jgi:hypothetical protein
MHLRLQLMLLLPRLLLLLVFLLFLLLFLLRLEYFLPNGKLGVRDLEQTHFGVWV